jgi:hypothetical protein
MYFIHVDGKTNPSDVMTKFLGWAKFWPLIQPFLFWKGETIKGISETSPIAQVIAALKEQAPSGLRGVTRSNSVSPSGNLKVEKSALEMSPIGPVLTELSTEQTFPSTPTSINILGRFPYHPENIISKPIGTKPLVMAPMPLDPMPCDDKASQEWIAVSRKATQNQRAYKMATSEKHPRAYLLTVTDKEAYPKVCPDIISPPRRNYTDIKYQSKNPVGFTTGQGNDNHAH